MYLSIKYQVLAVRVFEDDRVEAQLEGNAAAAATTTGYGSAGWRRDEEVFIAQLHRRACLLNQVGAGVDCVAPVAVFTRARSVYGYRLALLALPVASRPDRDDGVAPVASLACASLRWRAGASYLWGTVPTRGPYACVGPLGSLSAALEIRT